MKIDEFQLSCFEAMHRVVFEKSSGLTESVQSEDVKEHVGTVFRKSDGNEA